LTSLEQVQILLHMKSIGPKRRAAARPVDEILSARERQVMDVLYGRREATASEVHHDLPDAASYNAVRGVLRVLEEKGHVEHERDGRRYVYRPTASAEAEGRSSLRRVARTFFGGSAERVVSALFEGSIPPEQELQRLERLIAEARAESNG
jgi:predicted transcriptional regulator